MIRLEAVTFAYDGEPVYEGLDLEIPTGDIVAFMGPNGSGKTTLLKLIAGLVEPDSGTVTVETGAQTDESTESPAVGLAPENPDDGLFAATVREEVAFFPRNRGLPVDEHVDRALERLQIETLVDRTPQTLSQGEKRLVSLASVLSGDPDVIGLDEPTSGLDTPARDRLGEHLAALDRTILVATHDTDFVWEHAETALVLEAGTVHRQGPVEAVLGDADLDVESLGLRVPGPVRWAREHDFETPPASATEAAEWLGGGKQ